jgi:hypothetical protein
LPPFLASHRLASSRHPTPPHPPSSPSNRAAPQPPSVGVGLFLPFSLFYCFSFCLGQMTGSGRRPSSPLIITIDTQAPATEWAPRAFRARSRSNGRGDSLKRVATRRPSKVSRDDRHRYRQRDTLNDRRGDFSLEFEDNVGPRRAARGAEEERRVRTVLWEL